MAHNSRPSRPPDKAHDALFKTAFSRPADIASELVSVLPPAVAERIDLTQLKQVPGSFVDDDLSWRHTDLLFEAPFENQSAYIYVLVEHQSTSDPLMAFRLLEYMTRIWRQHLTERRSVKTLPPILPLVVSQDRRGWRSAQDLHTLLGIAPDAPEAAFVPQFRYALDDLAQTDASTLLLRPLTDYARVALFLLKEASHNDNLVAVLSAGWLEPLRAVSENPAGEPRFRAILDYILRVAEAPEEDVIRLAAQIGPKAQEEAMSTADQILTRGRIEGRVEGRVEMLIRQLSLKFGPLSEHDLDRLHNATDADLDRWADAVLTAATLNEALGR